MEISELEDVLKETETITFSKHFYDEKVRMRGVSEEDIRAHLKTANIISMEDQGEELQGHKYAVLFSKSNKYDLKIVISVKDKSLNVITAHIQNIKRRKVYQEWLKRQK